MNCIHPSCPMGASGLSWSAVLDHPSVHARAADKLKILPLLSLLKGLGGNVLAVPTDVARTAAFSRVLKACPCLYSQVDVRVTAKAVVHLCEITLNSRIDSKNVYQAFQIQHPGVSSKQFLIAPAVSGAGGGDIMEAFCSEVLSNHGLPPFEIGADKWPKWASESHISLNSGKMTSLKLYGDILIPCAPHNILISVKSEAARERFVVSGNRLESVGFGFFSDASEFWTSSRMNLLRRWGFVAVYMPPSTLTKIEARLKLNKLSDSAVNINGRPLYRSLEEFGDDMRRIAGKLSTAL